MIEGLSEETHLMTILFSRLNSFHESLKKSPKFKIRFLAAIQEEDYRTAFGRNLYVLRSKTNNSPSKSSIRELVKYFPIPDDEEWRLGVGKDLLGVRNGDMELQGFTPEEINFMLKVSCIS